MTATGQRLERGFAPTLAAPPRDPAAELTRALRALGAREGDTVMAHVDVAALYGPDDATPAERRHADVLAALLAVVGPAGTLLVPTYTHSFCRGEAFDPQRTPTRGGPWCPSGDFLEYVRTRPGAVRSGDPIHSITGIGPAARALLLDLAPTCFGPGGVFERLVQADVVYALAGVPIDEITQQHYTQELLGAPFRYRKLFTGEVRVDGQVERRGWTYSVHLRAGDTGASGPELMQAARSAGICGEARAGATYVLLTRAAALHEVTRALLQEQPWATARSPMGDPEAMEAERVGVTVAAPELPPDASMMQMIDALWRLPRDILSPGYDAALAALRTQLPMTVHAYPTGTECWSWLVPERWVCHEAVLETLDGRTLLSYADHPLHVVSYSLPFDGVVTRETLLEHVHVHPHLPDAVPFVFKYYERDWGLCCSRTLRDALDASHYRVRIRTSDAFGTLKVGEVVAPGRSDESVILCAHLCHPAQVNDDLSGVVVGMDVMRALLDRSRRGELRYTYRFLILPETIGSLAWLSHHEALIPRIRAGLFLEMLGLDYPLALQRSFAGTTEADVCFEGALRAAEPDAWTSAFRTLPGNDERQFNAPGVRVPMLSLMRVLPPAHPHFPYPQYHSSHDTPAVTSETRLAGARDAVLRMLDRLERNVVPRPRFAGEPFCSRYGLHVDPYRDPEGHRALFDVVFLLDGTRTIADIARESGASFETVERLVQAMARRGLVTP
jgi:aminopeptidase-like protein/aminoglycoside N3'-acetyltransferase